jgi:DNA-binding IclR family transcriptional regulator
MTPEPLDTKAIQVLVAVSSLPRPTARAVAQATGLGLDSVHRRLHQLRAGDLVAFEDHRAGTLRSNVEVVAYGSRPDL